MDSKGNRTHGAPNPFIDPCGINVAMTMPAQIQLCQLKHDIGMGFTEVQGLIYEI
jgi:hypothetical protein